MKKLSKTINVTIIISLLIPILMPIISIAASTDIAKIGENTYNSIYEAVQNAKEGDIVEILQDSIETNVINIENGITINGNGHKITSNSLSGTQAVFLVNTSNATVINNINVETSTRGVAINNNVHNFTINNSTLNVGQRGITINTNKNQNSILNVNNCIMQTNGIDNYNEETKSNDLRGISLWEYSNSTISIKNTTIQGFTYVINIAPQYYIADNTKLKIDNCILKGRAGINYWWTSGLDIEIKNSEILGINNYSGSSETFGDIVINETANANLNVVNTKLVNYQNEVGTNNPNALQYMLDVRSSNNTIRISGNTSCIDTTNKLKSVIKLNYADNDIEITGGTYDYDVSDYVPSDYAVIHKNGKYIVGKKAQAIEMKEKLELVVGDTADLGVVITPKDTIETIEYSSSDTEILEISSEGKITTKKPGSVTITVKTENIEKQCKVVVKEKEIIFDLLEINIEDENLNIGVSQEEKSAVNKILTDSIKNSDIENIIDKYKKQGDEISIKLQFDELENEQVSSDEKSKVEEMVKNGQIVQYYDISVIINANETKIGQLTELTDNINISVKIPKELIQKDREFYILRVHDGKVDKLETELSDDILTFRTNQFSTYILAYVDTKEEKTVENEEEKIVDSQEEKQTDSKEDTKTDENTQEIVAIQTGDHGIILYVCLAVTSIVGLMMLKIRKNQNIKVNRE